MGFTWDLWDETNKSHLKKDGWNAILSYWVSAYFQGRTVSSGRVNLFKHGDFGYPCKISGV